jgi:Ubiquitin family
MEPENFENRLFKLKIKTMDNNLREMEVSKDWEVSQLKREISQVFSNKVFLRKMKGIF